MKTTNSKGFSLIELLVALSILAVVAAIIVPRFLNVRVQAAQTTAQAQQRTIQTAAQQFIALGGSVGVTSGNCNAGDLLTVLATNVNTGSTRSSGSVADSGGTGGQFGSNTIALSIQAAGAPSAASTTASQGLYYAAGNTSAYYCDGAGSFYAITVDYTGITKFTAGTGSAVGAGTILQ